MPRPPSSLEEDFKRQSFSLAAVLGGLPRDMTSRNATSHQNWANDFSTTQGLFHVCLPPTDTFQVVYWVLPRLLPPMLRPAELAMAPLGDANSGAAA